MVVEAAPAPTEATAPSPPQVSFAGLLLALALALSLPLCVLALAASAVWRRRAPIKIETRETPITERYATRTEPEPASELVEMDEATRRVHREAGLRRASERPRNFRKNPPPLARPLPRRPSVASLLKARRELRASQFERRTCFDRDDAVAVEADAAGQGGPLRGTNAGVGDRLLESDGDSVVAAAVSAVPGRAACEEPVR